VLITLSLLVCLEIQQESYQLLIYINKVGENRNEIGLATIIFVHFFERSVCPISKALSPSPHQQSPSASCRQAHQHTQVSSPLDGSASPDPSPPPPPPRVRRKQHQHQCTTQRGAERMKRNSLAVELTNHHACHLPSQIQDRKLPKRSLYEKRPRKSRGETRSTG